MMETLVKDSDIQQLLGSYKTLDLFEVQGLDDYLDKYDDIRVFDMVMGRDPHNPSSIRSVVYDRPTCKKYFGMLFNPGVRTYHKNKYKEEFMSETFLTGDNQSDTLFNKIIDPPHFRWDVLTAEKRYQRLKIIVDNQWVVGKDNIKLLNLLPNLLIKKIYNELRSKYSNTDS